LGTAGKLDGRILRNQIRDSVANIWTQLHDAPLGIRQRSRRVKDLLQLVDFKGIAIGQGITTVGTELGVADNVLLASAKPVCARVAPPTNSYGMFSWR